MARKKKKTNQWLENRRRMKEGKTLRKTGGSRIKPRNQRKKSGGR